MYTYHPSANVTKVTISIIVRDKTIHEASISIAVAFKSPGRERLGPGAPGLLCLVHNLAGVGNLD